MPQRLAAFVVIGPLLRRLSYHMYMMGIIPYIIHATIMLLLHM